MEHSKKMILIDPRVLDSLRSSPTPNPWTSSLQEMDHRMKDILNRSDMTMEDKAQAYHQTLQRYLHRLDQVKRQSLGSVTIQTPTTIEKPSVVMDVPENPSSSSDKVSSRILDSMGKTFKKKARMILQHVEDHPDMSWNERGEFVWKGQRIENSNMLDLVNDLMRKRKNYASPHGWETFASALKTSNVPQELVGNPTRWSFMNQSNTDTLSTPPHSVSVSPKTPDTVKYMDTPKLASKSKSKARTFQWVSF